MTRRRITFNPERALRDARDAYVAHHYTPSPRDENRLYDVVDAMDDSGRIHHRDPAWVLLAHAAESLGAEPYRHDWMISPYSMRLQSVMPAFHQAIDRAAAQTFRERCWLWLRQLCDRRYYTARARGSDRAVTT